MTSWYYELPDTTGVEFGAGEGGSTAVAERLQPAAEEVARPQQPSRAFAPGLAALDAIADLVIDITEELERSQSPAHD